LFFLGDGFRSKISCTIGILTSRHFHTTSQPVVIGRVTDDCFLLQTTRTKLTDGKDDGHNGTRANEVQKAEKRFGGRTVCCHAGPSLFIGVPAATPLSFSVERGLLRQNRGPCFAFISVLSGPGEPPCLATAARRQHKTGSKARMPGESPCCCSGHAFVSAGTVRLDVASAAAVDGCSLEGILPFSCGLRDASALLLSGPPLCAPPSSP
jgi:hypothetical protein